ncbi:MAG: signal peptidase I [Clostridia bacterium]|nr:signal peptidase I [Clostridia bacterium]
MTTETKKNNFAGELLEWVDSIVVSAVVVVLLFTFVFKIVGIKGESMTDTLMEGDKVLVYSCNYTPEVGDIVVISRNASNIIEDESGEHERIIKRVIATEGQTVDINDSGLVSVDGVEIADSYIREYKSTFKKDVQFPHVVKEGCVFVLGDNRRNSLDSRSSGIGDVDVRYILGKAICRVSPFSEFKLL